MIPKIDRVEAAIKHGNKTIKQIIESTGLPMVSVKSSIDGLYRKGKLYKHYDEFGITFSIEENEMKVLSNRRKYELTDIIPRRLNPIVNTLEYRERPFSTNEMDYGSEGRKYKLSEVMRESDTYHPNTAHNRLDYHIEDSNELTILSNFD